MSEAVTIFACKTPADRDNAVSFLMARNYANITIQETTKISYDAKTFYDPSGRTDITVGFVVIGVK